MAVHIRFLSAQYSSQKLSDYRNILDIIPAILYLAYGRELTFNLHSYRVVKWRLAFGRGFLVTVAQFFFYSALAHLELATVSALSQTAATFIVLLAFELYGVMIGIWRWSAIIIGLLGAVIMVRPGSDISLGVLCSRFAQYFVMLLQLLLCAVLIILLQTGYSFYIISCGSYWCFNFSCWDCWIFYNTKKFGYFIYFSVPFFGGFGGFGVIFRMYAFRNAPSYVLAPFSYFGILNSFFLSWIFFGEFPIQRLFPGALLIIFSGLIIVWRERQTNNL